MEYETNITKDQILLAILKLSANNNAMLQIVVENLIEIRKTLLKIETSVDDSSLDNVISPLLDELTKTVRDQINDLKSGVESKSLREAYEWAFLNDPNSVDFSKLGLDAEN